MLKQRIFTACILVPIVLAILFYLPPLAFCFLVSFVLLIGAWEWSALMGLRSKRQRWIYIGIIALLFAMTLFSVYFSLAIACLWWIIAMVLVYVYPRGSQHWSKSMVVRGIMGALVLVPCWVALNYIRNQSDGIYALLFLLILIWGADISAFFVGRKFGRKKLVPQVSPGKTVAGLYGALICTFFITLIALLVCQIPLSFWFGSILISLLTVFFSIVGDLTESMLKRVAKLKDSGQMLPGHGGLLDRIDSLTAAAPVFVVCVLIFSSLMS